MSITDIIGVGHREIQETGSHPYVLKDLGMVNGFSGVSVTRCGEGTLYVLYTFSAFRYH